MAVVKDQEKRYRYFLYSHDQLKMRKEIDSGLRKVFIPGKVLVNGEWRTFTQISKTASNPAYTDAKVVAKGYLEDMTYKEPTGRWKIQI